MAKVEVSYKQVGKNLNVKIGDEVLTRTGTKEELAPVKEALATYKEKPIAKNLKVLKDLLKPKTVEKEKEQEKLKAEVKRVKRNTTKSKTTSVKKEESIINQLEGKIKRGEISDSELDNLRKLVGAQTEQKKSEPQARTGTSRRGEW